MGGNVADVGPRANVTGTLNDVAISQLLMMWMGVEVKMLNCN